MTRLGSDGLSGGHGGSDRAEQKQGRPHVFIVRQLAALVLVDKMLTELDTTLPPYFLLPLQRPVTKHRWRASCCESASTLPRIPSSPNR